MSDDLVKKLRDPALGFPDCFHQAAADRIEAQAARIAELEAALATARREGMEEAANISRKYAERYRGKYIEIAVVCGTIADAIRAAAKEGKP